MDDVEFQKKMESAKANLLDLSTHMESQRNETNQELKGEVLETLRDREKHTSLRGPSQVHEGSKDLGQAQPTRNMPSMSDLEEEGATKLLKDAQLSKYFQEYQYLYASSGELTIDEVENLLKCYKNLVLKYLSFSKATSTDASSNSPSGQKDENSNPPRISDDATQDLMSNETSKEMIRKNCSVDILSSFTDDTE